MSEPDLSPKVDKPTENVYIAEINLGLEMAQHCPLCQLSGPFKVFRAVRTPVRIVMDSTSIYGCCPRCGLVFQLQRLTDKAQVDFYSYVYRPAVSGSAHITPHLLVTETVRGWKLWTMLRRWNVSPKRILDVGSSTGAVMRFLRRETGAFVVGVEANRDFAAYSSTLGTPTWYDLDDVPGQFDLVIASHLLEHINDPVGFAARLAPNMAPGGKLLVEVPNLYSGNALRVPHPIAFSRRTLTMTLEKAGFRILGTSVNGKPGIWLYPEYIDALAEVSDYKILTWRPSRERWIAQKYDLGRFWARICFKLGQLGWMARLTHYHLPSGKELLRAQTDGADPAGH